MKAHPTMLWSIERTNRCPLMRTAVHVYSEGQSSISQKEKILEGMLGSIKFQSIQKNLIAIQNDQTTQLTLHQG